MIQGDVFTFLNALGAREGDPRLEHALAFVGGPHEVEVFDEGGVQGKYLVMTDRGVDFLLKDGVLTTVFVYATDTPDQGIYGGWESLVAGVGSDASSDAVVQALGAPLRSTESFVRYQVDPGFVQFDFDGDALIKLRAEDGKSGYPTPELLIAGLALPASRDTIGAHFGTPRQTSQQMDLYLVDDRYLRFDFDAELSTAVTVVLPGAEA